MADLADPVIDAVTILIAVGKGVQRRLANPGPPTGKDQLGIVLSRSLDMRKSMGRIIVLRVAMLPGLVDVMTQKSAVLLPEPVD
jgi:hypothetical protein